VLVLANTLRRPSAPVTLAKRVSRLSEYAALALALCSLLLAFAALGPVPGSLVSNPLAPRELVPTLLVLLGGALLALALSRRPLLGSAATDGPLRRVTLAAGAGFEYADAFLRRWASASLALLTLAALFGWLMLSRDL
jgi:multicomponent Na+:H+ antiporter subunit D